MSVHKDTLQGLQEVLEYARGDKTKGRSMLVTVPDDTNDKSNLLYAKIVKLSEDNQQRVSNYVDELLAVSNK